MHPDKTIPHRGLPSRGTRHIPQVYPLCWDRVAVLELSFGPSPPNNVIAAAYCGPSNTVKEQPPAKGLSTLALSRGGVTASGPSLKPKNSLSWRLEMHMSRPWDRKILVHYRRGLARVLEAGTIRCRRVANHVATAVTCIYRPTAAAWSRHVACGAFSSIFTGGDVMASKDVRVHGLHGLHGCHDPLSTRFTCNVERMIDWTIDFLHPDF